MGAGHYEGRSAVGKNNERVSALPNHAELQSPSGIEVVMNLAGGIGIPGCGVQKRGDRTRSLREPLANNKAFWASGIHGYGDYCRQPARWPGPALSLIHI